MVYRIAIVGLGKIATDQHVPCITKNKNFKLVATVSRNATLDDVVHFTSLSELIKSKMKAACIEPQHPPSFCF